MNSIADRNADRRGRAARWAAAALLAALVAGGAATAFAQEPAARAVLFFLPTCGHCEFVINEVLPGMFEETGGLPDLYYDETLDSGRVAFYLMTNGRLQILLVDASVYEGAELFHAATDAFAIPSGGVPRLIVGDEYMLGSRDIPDRFPGMVHDALESGAGIDWPVIPGLPEALAGIPVGPPETTTTTSATTTSVAGSTTTSVASTTTGAPTDGSDGFLPPGPRGASMADRFRQDRVANSISVVVLVLMVAGLGGVAWWMRKPGEGRSVDWATVVLVLAGLGVAAYLSFVEVGGSEAVCGPVGDCNTVQQSEYARLFGVVPVGIVGLAGYGVMLGAWAVARRGKGRAADVAAMTLFAGTVAGVLFSAYLTFLEPFV
ncbi:MAG: vitamin K epoxide reductase family protein, partial [Actinobacteria bacterium]|nr:vitamin K epoxide reductase family protein [Actinomycetota bacterium]